MITVHFGCGHSTKVDGYQLPQCPECGNTVVERVKAPAPRITGEARGPLVQKA